MSEKTGLAPASEAALRWSAIEDRAGLELRGAANTFSAKLAPARRAATGFLVGTGLHVLVPHPVWAAAVVAGWLAVRALLGPRLIRARAGNIPEPAWAAELAGYREWLPERVPPVPPETLQVFDRCIASAAKEGWRSAHVVVARPPDGQQISMAAARLLTPDLRILVSEATATGPADIAAVTVAHETRHASRRHQVMVAFLNSSPGAMAIAGWALAWPVSVWAALALHVAHTLLLWAVEIGGDLAGAASAGTAASMAACDVMAGKARARRHAGPLARLVAVGVLLWAAGPSHPPVPLRRAFIRARSLACMVHRGFSLKAYDLQSQDNDSGGISRAAHPDQKPPLL